MPEPRTGHNITNVEILEQQNDTCEVRFNWFTLYYRYQTVDPYFGTSFYTLDTSGEQPLIKRKKVRVIQAADLLCEVYFSLRSVAIIRMTCS